MDSDQRKNPIYDRIGINHFKVGYTHERIVEHLSIGGEVDSEHGHVHDQLECVDHAPEKSKRARQQDIHHQVNGEECFGRPSNGVSNCSKSRRQGVILEHVWQHVKQGFFQCVFREGLTLFIDEPQSRILFN